MKTSSLTKQRWPSGNRPGLHGEVSLGFLCFRTLLVLTVRLYIWSSWGRNWQTLDRLSSEMRVVGVTMKGEIIKAIMLWKLYVCLHMSPKCLDFSIWPQTGSGAISRLYVFLMKCRTDPSNWGGLVTRPLGGYQTGSLRSMALSKWPGVLGHWGSLNESRSQRWGILVGSPQRFLEWEQCRREEGYKGQATCPFWRGAELELRRSSAPPFLDFCWDKTNPSAQICPAVLLCCPVLSQEVQTISGCITVGRVCCIPS